MMVNTLFYFLLAGYDLSFLCKEHLFIYNNFPFLTTMSAFILKEKTCLFHHCVLRI